ncbi:MAG: Minf_1886 family protein [Candidatus Omnitrophota bacterium]
MSEDFYLRVNRICAQDARYPSDAYEFVMQALFFTQKRLKRPGHISAQELLDGVKEYAIDQFGPMSHAVLEHWGITATEDLGNIVFNMVENGLLKKTEDDKLEDFKGAYDLKQEFVQGYRRYLEKQIEGNNLL